MYTQENQCFSIQTPLGPDELILTGFKGAEKLSGLFRFELDLVSERRSIAFEEIVGANVTLLLGLRDDSSKYINGMISSFTQNSNVDSDENSLSVYTATMVPWFWLLTRTADSRIFQEKSVPDIVEQIFSEYELFDYTLRLSGTYTPREYTVQYRETDFNFISRLLEQEGIYYFFEHTQDKHNLILGDSPMVHEPCVGQEEARCVQSSGSGARTAADPENEEDVITHLNVKKQMRIDRYTLGDFNFKQPNSSLQSSSTSKINLGTGQREIYDYPGGYGDNSGGERFTDMRMEEEEARITTLSGSSFCRAFTSGYRFRLMDNFNEEMNEEEFVITRLEHSVQQAEILSGSLQPQERPFEYTNRFECMPFSIPFRPPRETRRPVVDGVQTAIVVGPAGEEIHTDEYGRVKVQFHWDREGEKNENSSCWIRVSQVWAGAGWGAMFIPRIGHEVIVDFEEGNPDRPIIIGRVYHANNQVPYPLPDEKTKSTIKSDSTIGGGGFNEFRFEDQKGSEEIFLHGQKDWTIAVENDKNQTVGHDETFDVGNNRTKSVGVNQQETIGANKTISVGGNHSETVGVSMTQTVGKNKTETIAINKAETIGAAKELTIGAAYMVTVGAAMTEAVGAVKSVNVGASSSEDVGSDKSVTSGKKMSLTSGDDFSISGGKSGVIDIKDELTIKVGKASINMKKNGDITIKGKNINIKGSGNIVMKAKKILEN